MFSALPRWSQSVDATLALNLCWGFEFRGLGCSLSWRATLFRWACEYTDKSSSLLKPRKYPRRIAINPIFPFQDTVLRRPVEPAPRTWTLLVTVGMSQTCPKTERPEL